MEGHLMSKVKCIGTVSEQHIIWSLKNQVDNSEKKYNKRMEFFRKQIAKMKPNITKKYMTKNSYERYLLHDMCKAYDKIKSVLDNIFISDISGIIASYCTTRKESKGIVELSQYCSKLEKIIVSQCCYQCRVNKKVITSQHPISYVSIKSLYL